MASLEPDEVARRAREVAYRRHILATAERLVGERGVDGARMQDLAAEAGVALATIYRHFPTKQALHRALSEDVGRAVFERAARAVGPDRTPLANLMGFVLEIVAFYLDRPQSLRFLLRTEPTSWGLGEDLEEWRAYRDFHADLVARCLEDGSVVGSDPRLVARMMGAIIQVQLSDWLEHGMRRDREAVVDEARDQLLRAFSATPAKRSRNRPTSR